MYGEQFPVYQKIQTCECRKYFPDSDHDTSNTAFKEIGWDVFSVVSVNYNLSLTEAILIMSVVGT